MPNEYTNIEPGACGLPGCNCRAEQAAARAATEALAEGAAAATTPADPATDEDGEDTCDNCGEDESDCGCFTCSPGLRREHLATSDTCSECCGRCNDHCECQQCPGCDRRSPDLTICGTCDHCDSRCCDCWYCEGCGESHTADTYRCDDCDTCTDRCECGSGGSDSDDPDEGDGVRGDSPRMFTYPLVFHRGRPARALPSTRFAAVEIEVQGVASEAHRGADSLVNLASSKWSFSVVRDGSLGTYGFEINTAPASGTAFIEQVNDICRILNANRARVDRSCGLHIHVDGRGLTPVEVLRFTRVSNAIRDAVTMVLPPSRHAGGNSYCIPYPSGFERTLAAHPLGDTVDSRFTNLAKAVYGAGDDYAKDAIKTMSDVSNYSVQKYANNRYWWINLHSWFHRGTIEVRSHSGTTSPRKMVMWAAFWCGLVDRVCRMTDEGAATLIEAAARDPWRVFLRLCPTPEVARFYAARRETFGRYDGYTAAEDSRLTEEIVAMETPVKRGLNIINIDSIITDTE